RKDDDMPPKQKYTKERIIDTAFDLAKVDGIENLTARKLADALGSSVAPIYANFEDIEALKKSVVNKIFEMSRNMSKEEITGDRFLDIGIASLRFAKEYSVLFKELVLKKNKYMEDYDASLGKTILQEMKEDSTLEELSDDELMRVLLKMRVFQLGLSVMVANDLLPKSFNEEAQIDLLKSMGSDVISGTTLNKKEK
ncbi:MAG TPA: TetR/AcrR family transcriptional regulator, partial [Clostridia bacterium]|nr:TetR/AcrR family transcriptional regulator [Clostridia bacterium]